MMLLGNWAHPNWILAFGFGFYLLLLSWMWLISLGIENEHPLWFLPNCGSDIDRLCGFHIHLET
jgi:hypothetical protein